MQNQMAVKKSDCVIGKVTTIDNVEEDNSKLAATTATIDKVTMYQERNGDRAVKVRTRQMRVPEIGDKFSSSSFLQGQK